MKPLLQTIHGDRGNCMSACLASILEIPIDDVPCFYDAGPTEAHWHLALQDWLFSRGWALLQIDVERSDPAVLSFPGYAIASGPSPRNPKNWHATVWKDGKIIHDPAGPGAPPLEAVKTLEFLYPLDPAKWVLR